MLITDETFDSIVSVYRDSIEDIEGSINHNITIETEENCIILTPKEATSLANLLLKNVADIAKESTKCKDKDPMDVDAKIEELMSKLKQCRFISDLYKAG